MVHSSRKYSFWTQRVCYIITGIWRWCGDMARQHQRCKSVWWQPGARVPSVRVRRTEKFQGGSQWKVDKYHKQVSNKLLCWFTEVVVVKYDLFLGQCSRSYNNNVGLFHGVQSLLLSVCALLPLVDIYEERMLHRDCMAWPIKILAGKKLLVRWLKGIQVTTGITSTHH